MKEADRELIQLCGKLRDEEISADELARLEARLEASVEDREYYLRFMQIDSILETYPPIIDETEVEQTVTGRRTVQLPISRAIAWMVAAAALTVALIFGVQSLVPQGESEVANRQSRNPIATLVFAKNCQWAERSFSEGQRLTAGEMELQSGTALIRFKGGAQALLQGPVSFALVSPMSARLTRGEMVVRAAQGADGFRLDTPAGPLIDLGTEFAITVEESGGIELHVHEGEVGLGESETPLPEHTVGAGEAVRMEAPYTSGWSEIALDASRFHTLLKGANPGERRDLMTAYEGFHVEPGSYSPSDLTGGRGWLGPWRLRSESEKRNQLQGTPNKLTIASSRMEVTWPIRGGELGMLELPEGPNVWIRQMKRPVRMNTSAIYYFSFLATEPERPEAELNENGKQLRQDLRFTFRSSDDYFGESISIGWDRTLRPRLTTNAGALARGIRTIPVVETVFCVAKIEARKTQSDRVSFRFYKQGDPLDIVEPAEWDIVMNDVRQKAVLDLLVLTSNSQQVRYLDEIRVGPSWRSVTPIDRSDFLIGASESP